MRYGILSDVHGNLEALEAVLVHLTGESIDRYVCLGDIVGYGADPAACLDRMVELNAQCVLGNHDAAAIGDISIDLFNTYAADAIRWTCSRIAKDHRRFLRSVPLFACEKNLSFAHASLHRPEWFEYLRTPSDVLESLQAQPTRVAFIGHSHWPIAYLVAEETLVVRFDGRISLGPCAKALFNVGSVGQPRDQDPRASCAVFDTQTEEYALHRLPYDVDRAADKILRAGLPALLAERLKVGL